MVVDCCLGFVVDWLALFFASFAVVVVRFAALAFCSSASVIHIALTPLLVPISRIVLMLFVRIN